MNDALFLILQFIVALVVMLILYFTVIVRLYPTLQEFKPNRYANPVKNIVTLVSGAVPLNTNNIVINTVNPIKDNFIRLPRCTYYLQGGFAYNFWLNTKSTSNTALYGKVLLLRGVNKEVTYRDLIKTSYSSMYLVKMPLIRFMTKEEVHIRNGRKADGSDERPNDDKTPYFVIEYNTNENPNEKWVVNTKIQNITRGDKFFMLTFVFHDYKNEYDRKDGYRIDMYIDNRLVASKVVEYDSLMLNNGPIYVLPNTISTADEWRESSKLPITGFMTDIRYIDFAPNINEIDKLFRDGFSKDNYVTPKSQKIQTMQDNYNLISLKNEMSQL